MLSLIMLIFGLYIGYKLHEYRTIAYIRKAVKKASIDVELFNGNVINHIRCMSILNTDELEELYNKL